MFTSSFACTPAIDARTSLAFMFDDVPEPVWKTSIGNWSSNSPAATRSPAAATRSAISPSSLPSSAFVRAAAALMRPSQRTTETGTRSPETGKFATAFVVSPPQSCCSLVSCVAISEPSFKPKSSPSRYLPAALRERPFALLFAAHLGSTVGNALFLIALPFAALELHASAGELGAVLAARSVPFAFFSLFGGAWADRVERRRLMIACDLVRVGTQGLVAALLLTGAADLWHLAVLAAIYGLADAVFGPALVGIVPAAAGVEHTQEANASLHVVTHAGQLVGAPLGGVLVAAFGAGTAIGVDAVTFLVSAAFLARMPALRVPRDEQPEPTLRAIATGWRAVRERPWVARFLPVLFVYHVAVLPCVFVLGPLIAERELDGATSWGIVYGAFGVGAVAGGILAIRWRPSAPMRAVGLAFSISSLQALVIALGQTTAGVAAFLGLAGIAVAFGWAMWEATVQARVPEHLVSRVISFDFMFSVGSLPLGLAIVGPIAEAAGLRPTMVVASALGATLAVIYALTGARMPGAATGDSSERTYSTEVGRP